MPPAEVEETYQPISQPLYCYNFRASNKARTTEMNQTPQALCEPSVTVLLPSKSRVNNQTSSLQQQQFMLTSSPSATGAATQHFIKSNTCWLLGLKKNKYIKVITFPSDFYWLNFNFSAISLRLAFGFPNVDIVTFALSRKHLKYTLEVQLCTGIAITSQQLFPLPSI